MLGVGWAVAIDALFGVIVFAGLFFDVVIYSIWLKRRTAWSIVWGGISGAMPILAGRALGLGSVDWIGVTLALGILFWIPTHTLTFSMKFEKDYADACVPTFPSTYGLGVTRATIAISSVLAALAMIVAGYGIGMDWGFLRLLGVLSDGSAHAGRRHHLPPLRARQLRPVQVRLRLHAGRDDFGCDLK